MRARRGAALLCPLLLACSSQARLPSALGEARGALEHAQLSAAREQAPAHLAAAYDAYLAARNACSRDPGTSACRDACYVARRTAEQAEAEGRIVLAHHTHQRAHLALAARRAQVQSEAAALPVPTEKLLARGVTAQAAGVQLALTRLAPNAEAAHVAGEGVRIRLSRPQAFVPGRSTLLPSARHALQEVARALQGAPEGQVHVGSLADGNESRDLARARAQAILAYLMACGLPATRLTPLPLEAVEQATGAGEVELFWRDDLRPPS